MKRKILLALVLVVLVVIVALRLASNKKKIDEKKTQQVATDIAVPVKVDTVRASDFTTDILKTGTISPYKEVKVLALNKSGTIKKLYINLGDKVRMGQVVALLDNQLLSLEVQKAKSHAAKLKEDLQTYTELLEGKAATQEKVNSIRQDYTDALNEVHQANKNISDATIKAPATGMVAAKAVEEGMFVSSGADIATIVDLSRTKIQVRMTESEVYRVAVGQSVTVTSDVYPGKEFHGKIDFISPQSDETHNYIAEILLAPHDATILRAGTFVYTRFPGQDLKGIIAIPREALTESVQQPYVYVVDGQIVHLRKITVNGEINGKIIVTGGLAPNDIIVTSGQINLKEGAKVNISK